MLHGLVLLCAGGIFAGLLAGLLGVGGGIILVPLFLWILPVLGIPVAEAMHTAVATSLAVIVITSLSSARVHWQNGYVCWRICVGISLGSVIGILFGINLSTLLSGAILHLLFGIITLLMAVRIIFNIQPKVKRSLPGYPRLSIAGFILGVSCALLGMGGGALIVPYLNRYPLEMRHIIATSAVCTIPIALMGTLGFLFLSINHTPLPQVKWASGYIYWPAFLAAAFSSVIFSPLGAKLAHRMPNAILKKAFGLFLVAVSVHMLTLGVFDHATVSKL